MFNINNFICQKLIWKMSSAYFLWFDYWPLKEWKTAKIQNNSVSAYLLFTQMIGPLFDMFTAAMFIFFCEIPICESLEQHSISFDGLAHLDWHFMEVG